MITRFVLLIWEVIKGGYGDVCVYKCTCMYVCEDKCQMVIDSCHKRKIVFNVNREKGDTYKENKRFIRLNCDIVCGVTQMVRPPLTQYTLALENMVCLLR